MIIMDLPEAIIIIILARGVPCTQLAPVVAS